MSDDDLDDLLKPSLSSGEDDRDEDFEPGSDSLLELMAAFDATPALLKRRALSVQQTPAKQTSKRRKRRPRRGKRPEKHRRCGAAVEGDGTGGEESEDSVAETLSLPSTD
ncbi:hypothetical protein PI124_g21898 [Phytophthora idaei]|nr:hypothetical protein PI125_g21084 [Phytophthora idaei]KAG3233024.1 hypothetical protein PI124_g21898 [Phytophthora idaei]